MRLNEVEQGHIRRDTTDIWKTICAAHLLLRVCVF